MAFPTSISAAQFSALAVANADVSTTVPATEAAFAALFATTADFDEIKNVRDFPDFGTPANVVKVPVYGQAQTQSVGAQSDAPDLSLTVNYVPGEWDPSSTLGGYVGDGVSRAFQFSMLTSKADALDTTASTGGLAGVPNANIYFIGRIESVLITPSRDDASTATVALSIQSAFYGPYTVD